MRPEDVGVETTLVLGKHSGRHAVKRRCEQLGYDLTRFELDRVYRGIIALADNKKFINDDDLSEIVTRVYADRASGIEVNKSKSITKSA
jgi:2-isopropylmalate synthase